MTTVDDFNLRTRRSRDGDVTATLLPDPDPRERKYTLISVDDHLVEPADTFEGRMPAKFSDQTPKIVYQGGRSFWRVGADLVPNVGFNACAGRPPEEWTVDPQGFSEMRRGCWDIEYRIKDMDIDGIWASMSFPSFLSGFAGTRFSKMRDQELGLALLRAWNDWHIEAWAAAYPARIIPLQITWLSDPEIAAQEIRRNAARGFKAVSFSENPTGQGLPSLYTGHWDSFLRACEETETVICLHIGSSTVTTQSSADAPPIIVPNLLLTNSFFAAAEWIWAEVPLRFPNLKIAMSEAGVSWVLALYDRLLHLYPRHAAWGLSAEQQESWKNADITPAESLLRNFYFCTFEDPSGMRNLDIIGANHVMLESDYPHSDGTWPNSQLMAEQLIGGLSPEDQQLVAWQNASRLFRHPVPPEAVIQ